MKKVGKRQLIKSSLVKHREVRGSADKSHGSLPGALGRGRLHTVSYSPAEILMQMMSSQVQIALHKGWAGCRFRNEGKK